MQRYDILKLEEIDQIGQCNSGRNSHCWQNFHSFKAEFYPLSELQLRPVLFRFVGCCLYLTTNYSFIQFVEGYFVFSMFIRLCCFRYYISKKLKNSDFEAKNKKRAEKGGNVTYPLWKCYFKWTLVPKDSCKFVQIGEQCYFERYHSGYLILVKSQCFFIILHFLCNNPILSVFTPSLLLQTNLIYFSPLFL